MPVAANRRRRGGQTTESTFHRDRYGAEQIAPAYASNVIDIAADLYRSRLILAKGAIIGQVEPMPQTSQWAGTPSGRDGNSLNRVTAILSLNEETEDA
jgi:hypothetical protein